MNKFILNTMNYKNLTKTQLIANRGAAIDTNDAYAIGAAIYAMTAAFAFINDFYYVEPKYWLSEYFKETGENRADYEAELERDGSFREVG